MSNKWVFRRRENSGKVLASRTLSGREFHNFARGCFGKAPSAKPLPPDPRRDQELLVLVSEARPELAELQKFLQIARCHVVQGFECKGGDLVIGPFPDGQPVKGPPESGGPFTSEPLRRLRRGSEGSSLVLLMTSLAAAFWTLWRRFSTDDVTPVSNALQ